MAKSADVDYKKLYESTNKELKELQQQFEEFQGNF